MEKEKKGKMKTATVVWTVVVSVLSGFVLGLSFLLYSAYASSNYYAATLERTYQKSYYDLVDKVNNMEVKISKVLSSKNDNYSAKVLSEISKNAEDAQNNLNVLPVSLNGIEESLSFINQVGGYTGTLSKNLQNGQSLSEKDYQTLQGLHKAILNMQNSLAGMSENMWKGYNILDSSLSLEGDYNNFTVSLQSLKASDVDYPTMIYDGPFADSVVKAKIKGLLGKGVSQQQAAEKLAEIMEINIDDLKFEGKAQTNFETYDFSFQISNISFYAQMTKTDGYLLTLSGYNDSSQMTVTRTEALQIAQDFLEKNRLNEVECVWSDVIGKDAYFNFAPVQNGIIIYPDLIKLKIDLAHGEVVGFESKSYYTNHTERSLCTFAISEDKAKSQVNSDYIIASSQKVLAPIEYKEVLCFEFKANKDGNLYYFYIDGQTGNLVNILRVVRTEDGSKLM